MAYVYLSKSLKDLNNYIGSTPSLSVRLKQYDAGEVYSTKYRRPLKLLGYRETQTLGEARVIEHKYKRSHGVLDRDIKNGLFKILDSN